MSDANKRSLRTLFHALIAMLGVAPIVLAALPDGSPFAAQAAVLASSVAAVSAVLNRLEDAGLIPSWLKDESPAA